MSELEAFAEAVAGEDSRIDLPRACLLIARDAYPGLDVAHYLGELERMALELQGRIQARLSSHPTEPSGAGERVVALNQYLFEDLGFQGNTKDYDDPRNSYLNDVLERRTGLPITLSIVYMAVGRRIGLPLEGVSFPGHFLVRMRLRGGMLVLDPFAGGAPLAEDDLRRRLQRVIPARAAGGLSAADLPLEQFLEPASRRQILARVLRNLNGLYRESGPPERQLEVLNRMLVLDPDSAPELRERGLLYRRLECWRFARQDLAGYLERAPDAPDAEEARAALVEVAARCARLN